MKMITAFMGQRFTRLVSCLTVAATCQWTALHATAQDAIPLAARADDGLSLYEATRRHFDHWPDLELRDVALPAALAGLALGVDAADLDDDVRDFAGDHSISGASYDDVLLGSLLTASTLGPLLFDDEDLSGRGGQTWVAVEALALTEGATALLKGAVERERPDESDRKSFPSGHTSLAFASAMLIHRQYGNPWASGIAFAAASATGIGRIDHDKHWATDVLSGAALGSLVASIVWTHYYDPDNGVFGRDRHASRVSMMPYLETDGAGVALGTQF